MITSCIITAVPAAMNITIMSVLAVTIMRITITGVLAATNMNIMITDVLVDVAMTTAMMKRRRKNCRACCWPWGCTAL